MARAKAAAVKAGSEATGKAQALRGGRIVQIQGGDADVPAFSIELVTPDSATELLQRKRPSAAENPAAINAYAEAMREGRWILNGMPLILSRAGVLLDGVQRLRACIKAGVPFLTVLAQNIPGRRAAHDRPAAPPLLRRRAGDAGHPACPCLAVCPCETDPL
jgi:hypothetical protein